MNDVTRILLAIEQGEPHASEQLLPLVYSELRGLAAQLMAQEKPGQTLDATALVHEAYLRLVVSPGSACSKDNEHFWNSERHFYGAAAEAMRRILVERARHKNCLKAGGGRDRVELDGVDLSAAQPCDDILALDEALEKLAGKDQRKAELVKLRYFAGLTIEQAAGALGISTSTADNDWAYARAWLRLELRREPTDSRGA